MQYKAIRVKPNTSDEELIKIKLDFHAGIMAMTSLVCGRIPTHLRPEQQLGGYELMRTFDAESTKIFNEMSTVVVAPSVDPEQY